MRLCGPAACEIGLKLVYKCCRRNATNPKGAKVMFAVQSAFNQVGVAFVVAVFSLGLLTLL